MATPQLWLNKFQVNTGSAATGTQSDPQIIGLSNGNILVAWTESATGAIGTPAGTDIIGKIYDAEGNVEKDSFRINTFVNVDNEGDFDIAATNDGGYAIAYIDNSLSSADRDVIWERHDSDGIFVNRGFIKNSAGADLSNPQIAVDLTDNTSVVTYTDTSSGNSDILGKKVSATGATGAEFDAAQNSSDPDTQGDLAVLSNGNYAQVYREQDAPNLGIELRIFTTAGTSVNTAQVATVGSDAQVTSLTNGNLVVTWTEANDIMYRIYNPTGSAVTGALTATGVGNQNESDVVALPDGDFVIVWDDDTVNSTRARRYNNTGTTDGFTFTVDTGNGTNPSVGVTGDGRILFTWRQGEIQASIWDPRSNPINAGDYDNTLTNFVSTEVITSRQLSSTVNGDGSAETILGQSGNDALNGGSGQDTIEGGAGNDTIRGGFGTDTVNAGSGNDLIIINDGEFIDNVDGSLGTDTLDLSDISGATEAVTINLTTNTFEGLGLNTSITSIEEIQGTQESDSITGNAFANVFAGNQGDDTLIGEGGNDSLSGGEGRDTLEGGTGNDTLKGGNDRDSLLGETGNDLLEGGNGNDTIKGGTGNDTLRGGQGADILKGQDDNDLLLGFGNNDDINGGSGNDTLWGGGGNDTLAGITGRDIINGSLGNDLIIGGDDRDTLIGSRGNDSLIGGNELDILNGTDNIGFGVGERDTLSGGLGAQDRFKLGETTGSYYLDAGAGGISSARIVDFESLDRIILSGSSGDYRLSTNGGDTFILRREVGPDDTVGIVENTVGLNLASAQFIYI